ncbi:DUF805 domain-containing protein [Kordia jejudonensis]|uniref:DUF805 domain-containing protein n=1 Tax=Kordia jejudonensis TaxID=1348245 RepID=UPI0006298EC9|nr:DUF805 domain-containing protein [Kordia jejudonensis]
MNYYIEPLKRTFDFTGKSTVKQFWMFFLIENIIVFIVAFFGVKLGIENLGDIYLLLTLLPFIALGFRRLNDAGYNKWLFLVPFVNIILASIQAKEA